MVPAKTRYLNLIKLALALMVASQKLKPYFQAYLIVIFTSHLLRQVLHCPKASKCLMRWSIKLSQYEICYLPWATIKGQAMANFIVELTPNKENEMLLESNYTAVESPIMMHPTPNWELYVDGFSSNQGCRVGFILTSIKSKRLRIEYTLRLRFKASNNEAKYGALLTGLRLALVVGAKLLHIFNDFQLVV